MELARIQNLVEQIKHMEKTPHNLSEAIGALCSIVEELIMAVNSAQREIDDWDNYRIEQNKRKPMKTYRKRAIIIGPYRSDIAANIAVARRCAVYLWDNGCSTFCPHLNTAFFHNDLQHFPDEAVTQFICDLIDTGLFDMCVVLPGWRDSDGTQTELDHIAHYISLGNDIDIYIWNDDNSSIHLAELTPKRDIISCQESAPTTG